MILLLPAYSLYQWYHMDTAETQLIMIYREHESRTEHTPWYRSNNPTRHLNHAV